MQIHQLILMLFFTLSEAPKVNCETLGIFNFGYNIMINEKKVSFSMQQGASKFEARTLKLKDLLLSHFLRFEQLMQ